MLSNINQTGMTNTFYINMHACTNVYNRHAFKVLQSICMKTGNRENILNHSSDTE